MKSEQTVVVEVDPEIARLARLDSEVFGGSPEEWALEYIDFELQLRESQAPEAAEPCDLGGGESV